MSKKNAWKNKVLDLLSERAMSSTEISEKLGRVMRYAPHARKITLVLRGDKRFRELEQVSVDSWLRAESHKVSLWGLLDQNYAFDYPYTVVSA
tara:strand:- start:186 stop:464 length:279 start_codon:yes stop_codon:yes gene_type:complete